VEIANLSLRAEGAAISLFGHHPRDCFVAVLLAMTVKKPASGTTEDENVACSHRLCLSVIWKQEPWDRSPWIPAFAGMTDKCGNDTGVEFIQTYQGILVAMTGKKPASAIVSLIY